MKIGVACDHAGFDYKEKLKELLSSKGNEINDYGCYSLESVDYPDFAHKLAESIEKGENKLGYFNIELIKPIAPQFFDDKKRSICVLSASTILKILLPEGQINKKIYESFESLINQFISKDWIILYIYWELSLIKELGFEVNLLKNENNWLSNVHLHP